MAYLPDEREYVGHHPHLRRKCPLITAASLRSYTCKDLSEMAKTQGVEGWYSMRKEELIRALVNKARAKARRAKRQANPTREATAKRKVSRGQQSKRVVTASRNGKAGSRAKHPATDNQGSNGSNGRSQKRDRREAVVSSRPKSRKVLEQIQEANERRDRLRDLSSSAVGPPAKPAKNGNGKRETKGTRRSATRDRVVLLVRDSYWLHAVWEIRRQTVERVKAALAEHWHTARPILRLIEVDGGATTGTAERVEREIDIHGGVNNWYIDVHEPPKHYRVAIGYLAADGRFHALARSNSVTTPPPGSSDSLDENWREVAKDYEHVYAMSGGYRDEPASGDLRELFEERLRHPWGCRWLPSSGFVPKLPRIDVRNSPWKWMPN